MAGTPRQPRKDRPVLLIVVVAAVVLVLVGVTVGVIVSAATQQADLASTEPTVVTTQEFTGTDAAGQDETGGVVVGETGPVTLTLYEDFLCPACRQFEQVSGEYLQELEAGSDVTVEYRPIAILDRLSAGSEYSTRSGAAAMCVAENDGPDVFRDYVEALFANQPAEGGPGPDDESLAALATTTGATQASEDCITEGTFVGWVGRSTTQASDLGVSGTPTVWLNGQPTEARTPEDLQAAIDAAAG